jgi:transcriptional regulator with XRE-family HTH domain
MEKSIYTNEYPVLVALLQETRRAANLTQVELAQKIGQSQSFVSKAEIGERRLDLIQLRTLCQAMGTTLSAFVSKLEDRLAKRREKGRSR